ncbi:ATP-dependent helicase [Candidatus Micrarchaeota archaeon]|nr:ATP-dependent helicase [Candidatus Micrarchaeota archaeon]MBU2476972.1 ATP-dependent helicase [Candidatus Micrarchaeota archaeon]
MISFQKEKYSDKEIYAQLHPLLGEWFKEKFKVFTEPQKYAIPNIHNKENTLISAVTGSGKTLSAFTAILNELIIASENNSLEDKVYAVYISPLKALNNDIKRNLLEPLKEIKAKHKEKKNKKEKKSTLGIRVGVRTGDTTQSERSAMLKKPPHILISTPESLAIILNAPKFREKLKEIKWLIIDEIHALADNKRGSHLSISMERLQKLSPEITRIGLSATIAPIQEVAKFLVGEENGKTRPCKIIEAKLEKKLNLNVLSPLPNLIDVSQEQIHESLYSLLDQLIQDHKTTLIFTNTRSATERVVHHLKEKFPANYSANIGAHHSSLARSHRLGIEERLKKGELKVVVSSTSLELGIDIGFIDLVILLGSPKSVARALQRTGRSGHKLHDEIKGRLIVMDRDDLIECAVLMKNALEHKIDRIQIPKAPLDVLAQQIYGIAIEESQKAEDVFALVKQAYPFSSLKRSSFYEIIDYLRGEYTALETRHVYAKIWFDEETGFIGKRGKMARIIYMTNIGTIPDEARITVKIKEYKIGSIDEGFLERLNKGDVFVLGGQSYEFRYASGMTAQVATAYKRPPTVPAWFSEMLPLSFDLSLEIQKFRELMEQKFKAKKSKKEIKEFIKKYLYVEDNTVSAIYEYFKEQFLYLEIPTSKKLLIEVLSEANMRHAIFHSLYGRRVNDALSRAYAFALSRLIHKDVEISITDNGFVLSVNTKLPLEKMLSLVSSAELRKICVAAIERTEVLNRRFRHCAVRSLMILRSYKGRTKTAGRQQMASRLLITAVKRIDEKFPILEEARREVLEDLMDISNTEKVLQGIEQKLIETKIVFSDIPSPFAFNLFLRGRMDVMKIEDKIEFIKRLHKQIQERINSKSKQ